MAYVPTTDGYTGWHAEIIVDDHARLGLLEGTSREALMPERRGVNSNPPREVGGATEQ